MLKNSNIIFGIGASHFIKKKVINLALLAHFSFSLMSFQFSTLSMTCLSWFYFIYIHMNLLGSKMQILLSNSVVLLLISIAFSAIMLISILLSFTSFGGCTPTSRTSPSSTSFCVAFYPFTPSFSSNFWMYFRSISVSWASLLTWTLTSSLSSQKFYYICS
jgi:hypothetical protein